MNEEPVFSAERRLCLGVVVGVHGVRGAVRLKSFTQDPRAVAAYGALTDARGERAYRLRIVGQIRETLLAEIDGVSDRTEAERLKGLKLYAARAQLPALDQADEFYHADLVGLAVETVDGEGLGRVAAIHDFGAGTSIEIVSSAGKIALVPFTREVVPVVDLVQGRLIVAPVPGLLDPPPPPAALEEQLRAAEEVGTA